MGLFISSCKRCGEDIEWFMNPPKHYVCKCGEYNSPEYIQFVFQFQYSLRWTQYPNSISKEKLRESFNSYLDSIKDFK